MEKKVWEMKKDLIFNRREGFENAQDKYLSRIPKIKEIARLHGYAISIHGSQKRDFDLIAAPWVADASDPDPLIKDLVIAAEGVLQQGSPTRKPHGRLCFNIMIGGHLYFDVSVMPKKEIFQNETYTIQNKKKRH